MGNTYIWEVCGICVICERIRREEIFCVPEMMQRRVRGGWCCLTAAFLPCLLIVFACYDAPNQCEVSSLFIFSSRISAVVAPDCFHASWPLL